MTGYVHAGGTWVNVNYPAISTEWILISIDFISPGTDIYLYFSANYPAGGTFTMSFDNIKIQALDEYDTQVIEGLAIPQSVEIDDKKRHVFSTNYVFRIKKYN